MLSKIHNSSGLSRERWIKDPDCAISDYPVSSNLYALRLFGICLLRSTFRALLNPFRLAQQFVTFTANFPRVPISHSRVNFFFRSLRKTKITRTANEGCGALGSWISLAVAWVCFGWPLLLSSYAWGKRLDCAPSSLLKTVPRCEALLLDALSTVQTACFTCKQRSCGKSGKLPLRNAHRDVA